MDRKVDLNENCSLDNQTNSNVETIKFLANNKQIIKKLNSDDNSTNQLCQNLTDNVVSIKIGN